MVRIAKHAAEKNKVMLMNMSAPFLCTFFKEPMLKMLPYVDYFFGNESVSPLFIRIILLLTWTNIVSFILFEIVLLGKVL